MTGQDFINSEAQAKQELHAAMSAARRQRIVVRWVVVALCAIGLIAIVRGVQGAERTERHAIYIYVAGKDLRADRPNIIRLDDHTDYTSRQECKDAILFVKVRESGARLRCDAVSR